MSMRLFLVVFIVFIAQLGFSQNRIDRVKSELDSVSRFVPELNDSINFSVKKTSLQQFIRAVAVSKGVNVSINPSVSGTIANNFKNVRVRDLFVFLCKEFDLEIEIVAGNIFSFSNYIEPKKDNKDKLHDRIRFDKQVGVLSLDLQEDTLLHVVRRIAKVSNHNFSVEKKLHYQSVSGFVDSLPVIEALTSILLSNGMKLEKDSNNIYRILEETEQNIVSRQTQTSRVGEREQKETGNLELSISSTGLISCFAEKAALKEILVLINEKLGNNLSLLSDVNARKTLYVKDIGFDQFLILLFKGTEYNFKLEDNVLSIDAKGSNTLKETRVVVLENRSSKQVVELIPSYLVQSVEIKEIPELNSLVVSGTTIEIEKVELFLMQIDRVVPVILIEVLIVDSEQSSDTETGINAQLGTPAPSNTSGQLFPKVDLELSTSTINQIISSFNGFGVVNLGKVTPDFYLSLKALQEAGIIDIRSTPKLSSMNSHEAIMTIGSTRYYKEETTNFNFSQTTNQVVTENYRPVQANFSLKITPHISGNEQITLEIAVEQSDFTESPSDGAPPGAISRKFESNIRVMNGEMILLGGLEEKRNEETNSGVPFLAKVPVIKWLFSDSKKASSKKKLNIFIKPTIVY